MALALGVLAGAIRTAGALDPAPVAECAAAPRPCVEGRRTKLRLALETRRLKLKWTADRRVVDLGDFGNPAIGGAGFDFCLYDAAGALVMATGVPPGGSCSGRACWRAHATGFRYADPAAGTGGLTGINLRAGLGRMPKITLAGLGDLLPLPAEQPAAPLTAQIVRADDPAVCWTGIVATVRTR